MKLAMHTALPVLAGLAATAACGSLSGSTDQPSVLATIHGTVNGSQSTSSGSGPLAVAILWAKLAQGSPQVVSTSAAVTPTFPSSFSLDLTELPPDSVMFDLASINCGAPPCDMPDDPPLHVQIALGGLVLYEDLNHNGRLDLVAPGAPAYVDKIVGEAPYEILYTEQPLPHDQNYYPIPGTDGSVLQKGYNWVRVNRFDCEPGDGGFNPCTSSVLYRSIDTPVTVEMFDPEQQAEAASLMCAVVPASGGGQQSGGGTGTPPSQWVQKTPATFGGPLPSSDDPELLCDSPTSFRYGENCTTTSPGICLGETTTCTQEVQVTLPPGTPPADWPCVPQRSF
jgi:hypothetical protein